MLALHHDYPSAASLHAVLLLDEVTGGDVVVHHGVDVLGLATAVPATVDDVADWDRHREALAEMGWDVARPGTHPPTLAAHQVAGLCPDRTTARSWRLACYRAHWLDGADIGDHDVLVDLAERVGLAPGRVHRHLDDRVAAAAARRAMLAARQDGVGGVPVLDVDGTKVSPFMPREDLRALVAL